MAYPRTAAEFTRQVSTEEACWDYLVKLRWPEGFHCPDGGSTKAWLTSNKLFRGGACDSAVSVTAGTIFQDTRKPLRRWFQAMGWVVGQKNGASAVGLNRVLGIGSDKTAWTWLHTLRRARVRPGREPLTGEGEVDERFVGGVEEGGGRRHIGNKALVVIAAEIRGNGIGRIRMKRISDGSSDRLTTFVREAVEKGGVVVRDGRQSYRSLPEHGDRHTRRIVTRSTKEASTLLPRVHRVASLLKRGRLGTHHGAVSREHLASYLDEFTFRFPRRTSQHRGKLFYRLLQQAVAVSPAPYDASIKHVRGRQRRTHNQ